MKTVAALGTTLVLAAVVSISPIGVLNLVPVLNERELEQTRLETYQRNISTMEQAVISAAAEFNEARSFEVYYGDLPKIREVFSGIAGITVKEEVVVKPLEGFSDGGFVSDGVQPSAVRFVLVTDDPGTAISVVAKMELPVYSLSWESPNSLSVTFLTGGEV